MDDVGATLSDRAAEPGSKRRRSPTLARAHSVRVGWPLRERPNTLLGLELAALHRSRRVEPASMDNAESTNNKDTN